MTLYYEDDFVTLYHGDCLKEHREWLKADVLVTDPPYGVSYKSGARRDTLKASILNDTDTSNRDAALEAWGDRPALVFGSWKIQRPAGTKALLIWDTKGALGMGDLRIPWKPAHQEIYVLGEGPWQGKRDTDVLSFAPVQSMSKNGRLHPHQKPVPLMEALMRKTVGSVIADPFAGSGSTLVAAKAMGLKSIGVELDERDCEIIAKRCSQEVLDIFGASA
ncbi:site-specific DNA-methyltransferase [Paenarthrobacter nitroguajacolicus]|uniref:DNA-methyltransferase n=1 Tax=Paenarthrobacter nitroguajacolicus TaxID=211146 RepID=UPI0015C1A469|nr:DNA methyltransferase [Paenarthrobacter nitroguajacolicus]NWL13281.1 site-specific DNA-methyltransferase [Paenarthrobacter nitroguajacolicus]